MTTLEATDKEPAWAEAEVSSAKTLWEAGMSASQIAARLGTGKSRNAILGKLHRLGVIRNLARPDNSHLDPKERTRKPRPMRQAPSMPSLKKPAAPVRALVIVAPPPAETKDGRITVANLEPGMCKWPIGDPQHDDFCFCGNGQVDGKPYCEFHAKLARGVSTPSARNLMKSASENRVMRAIR